MNHSISRRTLRRLTTACALVALTAATTASVQAASSNPGNLGNPGIAPPQSSFRGQTYGEWSAAWFQWVMSLPTTHHPLFDNADCSAGQHGNVWFIGGKLDAPTAANRNCTIPPGTALFLAIAANGPVDNSGCDASGTVIQKADFTLEELREFNARNEDGLLQSADRGFLTIDGVSFKNLSGLTPPYRVQSSVFAYTIPAADNILVLLNGDCYIDAPAAERTITPAVADGVYVMILPLSVGQHTITFGKDFGQGVLHTYHITVTPH